MSLSLFYTTLNGLSPNHFIINKEDRIKELEGKSKERDVEPTDDVQQWKRIACKEVLKVFAPPGKAPLVTARAACAYSCYDTRCSYKNRTNCLDTYIKHLLDTESLY